MINLFKGKVFKIKLWISMTSDLNVPQKQVGVYFLPLVTEKQNLRIGGSHGNYLVIFA
jgi:hypothetical protein